MPRKASGEPKTKRVERRQTNGDIYVYEVTTLYNPKKRYNEHVSSRLLGKKSANGNELLPTRPRKVPGAAVTAVRKTVGVTDCFVNRFLLRFCSPLLFPAFFLSQLSNR